MNNVLCDPKYDWSHIRVQDGSIYVKGGFYFSGFFYNKKAAAEQLKILFLDSRENLHPIESIYNIVENIRGNFSFIIDLQDSILAVVDRIRSYPIYYSHENGVLISNSQEHIKSCFDKLSMLELRMSGFVINNKTLCKNIYQLLPGEFFLYKKNSCEHYRKRYYQFPVNSKKLSSKSEDDLLNELHNLHLTIFSEIIESLDGRPVWVPLSGGLDSRFILAMFLECGYKNLTTFSYGVKNFWEIKRAKKIANFARIKWHALIYKPYETRKYFYTKEREDYYSFASSMNAVPAMNDYYAIIKMKNSGLIPHNAVFINGQTGDFITGGHIPDIQNGECKVEYLLKKIIDKHYSLWAQLKTEKNIQKITNEILSVLNLKIDDQISKDDFVKYYEYFEWQERQCKFVINGQRVYEWFGYEWKLPLWDDRLMFFWESVPWEMKAKQKLFKKYLKVYNPAFLFDKDWSATDYKHIPLFLRVATSISKKIIPTFNFQENFVNYYSTYAAYHPQKNYWQYLKESKGSRNAVSFHAKKIADGMLKNECNSS